MPVSCTDDPISKEEGKKKKIGPQRSYLGNGILVGHVDIRLHS